MKETSLHRARRLFGTHRAAVACSALLLGLSGFAAHSQTPPTPKRVPPLGVAIPDNDRKELEAGVTALRNEINSLTHEPRLSPELRALLPDVEIFEKAVDWALKYNEFYNVKQVETAKALLAEGNARAKALHSSQAPWTTATGLVVRGYRSLIDGSVQPYGMVVPTTWQGTSDHRPRRLYIWNHGRSENLTELAFINERMHSKGDFTPEDGFVIHAYGRFCNATKFAGETDVFEGLDAARKHYPVDERRIVMTGFSMGGASVWHLAAHHSSMWCAATPGAGFAETQIYTKAFASDKEPPPWWEQTLWHLYDATDYVANFADTHVIAYSGEIDPQKQSADLMEKAAAGEGLKLERLIGPNTAHKYEPATKKELSRRLEELATQGRSEVPSKVRLVTYTLRYDRQDWVQVDALEKHWERADVTAEIADEGTIKATTKNVAALTFDIEAKTLPFDATRPPHILLDGQELSGPPVASPWKVSFEKTGGKWAIVKPGASTVALQKRHGLQGPIDDAFMESFVLVRPTGTPLNATVGAWTKSEIERVIPQWRAVFRGDARVVDDTAVTPALINDCNLVLWGDPSSNRVLQQILPKLPLKWTTSGVQLGNAKYPAANCVPIMIYPNPLNPRRYVVINSSFTFRQGSDASNATQTPKLPDWAIVDLRTPASDKAPGLVMDAGFFGEQWQLPN